MASRAHDQSTAVRSTTVAELTLQFAQSVSLQQISSDCNALGHVLHCQVQALPPVCALLRQICRLLLLRGVAAAEAQHRPTTIQDTRRESMIATTDHSELRMRRQDHPPRLQLQVLVMARTDDHKPDNRP